MPHALKLSILHVLQLYFKTVKVSTIQNMTKKSKTDVSTPEVGPNKSLSQDSEPDTAPTAGDDC